MHEFVRADSTYVMITTINKSRLDELIRPHIPATLTSFHRFQYMFINWDDGLLV